MLQESLLRDSLTQTIDEAEDWLGFSALFQALCTPGFAERNAVLVTAHPGDETIAVGGHLAALAGIAMVHATDGIVSNEAAPDRSIGPLAPANLKSPNLMDRIIRVRARRRELEAALAEAGFAPDASVSLGIAATDCVRHLPEVARTLAALFRGRDTRLILTHAYEGGDADRDSICVAVHAACALIARDGGRRPTIIEMPVFHPATDGLVAQRFPALPNIPDIVLPLDDEAWERKQRMMQCFSSLRAEWALFRSQVERFRQAPAYDFALPPNGGHVLYAGLSGAEWLRLVRDGLVDLGLSAPTGKSDSPWPYPDRHERRCC